MEGNSEKYHRRSIRLKGYDYSQKGVYFITICTYKLEFPFGEIANGKMQPNACAQIVQAIWDELPSRYPEAKTDAFVIMPNHVHGIIVVGAIHELPLQLISRRHMLIPKLVGWFKMNTAKRINKIRHTPGIPLWQRNYWEHVIRSEDSLNNIREYIVNNPLRWHLDKQNPNRTGEDDFDRRKRLFFST